ncbi:MAG: lipid-A-disaccharide synthase N-terminal domain-containing protein [Candidatus Sumerlaeia bacterium]|nr:lipid-A-disaccharide synthase N-terminal domain-containing protein [Candidatus Sumerlaeia bacterium]
MKQELDKILLNVSDKWEFGAWAIFGLFGQTLFFSRFLIQWLVSEKKKKSVIPLSFWYLSLFGSIIVLIYAIQKKDIVFTLAMAFGFTVYTRNLIFIYREKLKGKANSHALLNEE